MKVHILITCHIYPALWLCMLFSCGMFWLLAFLWPNILYLCTGSYPSWHKAVWDLGSGLQLFYLQRGCIEPEKEVKCLTVWKSYPPICVPCKLFICCRLFYHNLSETFVSFCHRVEAVCPRVAELNPYVHVDMSSSVLDDNTDLSFLRKYQVCRSISKLWVWPWCMGNFVKQFLLFLDWN